MEVVYETFPGWKTSISGTRSFADLPRNAQAYIVRLEELLHVPGQRGVPNGDVALFLGKVVAANVC